MADLQDFAGVVALAIKAAMAPVLERVALMEAQVKAMSGFDQSVTELRERLVVAETKAAFVVPPSLPDGFIDRLTALEVRPVVNLSEVEKGLSDLRERVVVAETKASAMVAPQLPEVITSGRMHATLERADALTERVNAMDSLLLPDRVKSLETTVLQFGPLKDVLTVYEARVSAIETKAAKFTDLPEFITSGRVLMMAEKADLTAAEVGDLAKDVSTLRERVAVVEVRQPVPGPAGLNGKDGAAGVDGLGFEDVGFEVDPRGRVWIKACRGDNVKRARLTGCLPRPFQEGTEYLCGDKSMWDGSEWTALRDEPPGRPGDGSSDVTGWLLTTKRGKDGRDLRDAKDVPSLPVVKVGA